MPVAGGGTSRSGLAGFAAQFGVGVPGQDGGQSATFYAGLLTSRAILRDVVETPFPLSTEPSARRSALPDLLGIGAADPILRRDLAIEALRGAIAVRTNAETGLVEFSVSMRSAALAAAVAQRMLDLVNEFNLRSRQARATAEMRFIDGRLQEANAELRSAEARLQGFLEQNRNFSQSPYLAVMHERLLGDVGMRRQLYATLAQAHEQARIDAVRNTPLIATVEVPEVPSRPASRGLLQKALLGVVLGGLFGALFGVVREARERRATAIRASATGSAPRLTTPEDQAPTLIRREGAAGGARQVTSDRA